MMSALRQGPYPVFTVPAEKAAGNSRLSAEAQRESLLNASALMFTSGVLLIAFWLSFPRQPAFQGIPPIYR